MINSNTAPVTVIIPTYNRADLIAQSIDSVLDQTWRPHEIIVVVDGSTDDTAARLQPYADRVQVVVKDNGGKSSALNLGLSMASQPYVWIFDDDDIATPDALRRLVLALEVNPDAGFSYGLLDKFYGGWPGEVTEPLICYRSSDQRALYLKLMQDFFIWQGAMLVRKSCYDSVGPFDLRFSRSQDYQMLLRLARRFAGVGVPEVMFHQRHHEGERGPQHARFKSKDAEAVWARFNRLMFDEIYESHGLDEFCIGAVSPDLDARAQLTALLQRAAIMARKGIWTRAIADMMAASTRAAFLETTGVPVHLQAQEMSALRAVFEHGARSAFPSFAEAKGFRRALANFTPELRSQIIGNLLLPVTNRIKLLPSRVNKTEEARQIAYQLACLGQPAALPVYLAARRTEYRLYGVERLNPSPDDTALRLRRPSGPSGDLSMSGSAP
jgi:glycosyltransferase involved in cell wall biosynthesis